MDTESGFAPWDLSKAHILVSTPDVVDFNFGNATCLLSHVTRHRLSLIPSHSLHRFLTLFSTCTLAGQCIVFHAARMPKLPATTSQTVKEFKRKSRFNVFDRNECVCLASRQMQLSVGYNAASKSGSPELGPK